MSWLDKIFGAKETITETPLTEEQPLTSEQFLNEFANISNSELRIEILNEFKREYIDKGTTPRKLDLLIVAYLTK